MVYERSFRVSVNPLFYEIENEPEMVEKCQEKSIFQEEIPITELDSSPVLNKKKLPEIVPEVEKMEDEGRNKTSKFHLPDSQAHYEGTH